MLYIIFRRTVNKYGNRRRPAAKYFLADKIRRGCFNGRRNGAGSVRKKHERQDVSRKHHKNHDRAYSVGKGQNDRYNNDVA